MPEEQGNAFAISEDLVESPRHKEASTKSVDFDGLLRDCPLRLHEDLSEGNGGQAWPAGFVLARYLLRNRDLFTHASTSVVELGSGGGLVGYMHTRAILSWKQPS